MSVRKETKYLMDNYVRNRTNQGRKDTRARALIVADFLASIGVKSLGQVGNVHVIKYWKANRHRKDATLKHHYYAIKKLWELYGKAAPPPLPNYNNAAAKPQKKKGTIVSDT